MQPTFITGNADKAKYLEKFLGVPIKHQKIDLPEIQSLDLNEIIKHKAEQAYNSIQAPIIVEDVSLEFQELNGLPGTFIKFFIKQLSLQQICDLLKTNRNATAKCSIAYYDGEELTIFQGKLEGEIATTPQGENGYGWDKIFIPQGYQQTRAQLSQEDDKKTYLQYKPINQLKSFLEKLQAH